MAHRMDLLAEINTTLDGAGNYVGDWFDSAGIRDVRVLHSQVAAPGDLQQSTDQTVIVGNDTVNGSGEVPLTARYFRLVVNGGTANAAFRAVLRAVN